jgi:hypothetical protein
MGMHESCFTGCCGALAGCFDARVGCAADAGVRVVEADGAGGGAGHVYFDEDRAGEDVGDRE